MIPLSPHELIWAVVALACALCIVIGALVFLWFRYRQLTQTVAHLTRGKRGATLEDTIHAHNKELDALRAEISALREEHDATRAIAHRSIHHVHVVRYNPFKDLGGDQSFALALLNAHGDGVIVSSLHTRDGTRIYAKPLTNHTSPYTLSDEEREALTRATTEQN